MSARPLDNGPGFLQHGGREQDRALVVRQGKGLPGIADYAPGSAGVWNGRIFKVTGFTDLGNGSPLVRDVGTFEDIPVTHE